MNISGSENLSNVVQIKFLRFDSLKWPRVEKCFRKTFNQN